MKVNLLQFILRKPYTLMWGKVLQSLWTEIDPFMEVVAFIRCELNREALRTKQREVLKQSGNELFQVFPITPRPRIPSSSLGV